ncbi:MAG TPA: DNA polymerase III subunit delta [Bacteroidales bacterium]|nr:DNA polymerase III subunit delta [Bacteroidales bacterium]
MRFSEIIGQVPVKNYLVNTVKNSRVSHAQLFLGAEGCGKLALAIAYAQFICCTNKQYYDAGGPLAGDSCGVCPSCLKYAKLIHPDIHFFYPVTTTKDVKTKPQSIEFVQTWRDFLIRNDFIISLNDWYDAIGVENKQGIINAEDCNEIIRKLSLKSYESEYKIIIMWMVEKLYPLAAPKILKILEEPPEKTLFILIAENHEQIISTILSRTQMVKIPRLGNKDISNALINKYNATEIDARKIANVADGNLVFAKSLLHEVEEDGYYFSQLQKWLRLCYRFNSDDVFELSKFIDEMSKIGRENQKIFFIYALKIIRNTSLINHGNEKLMKLVEDESEFVKKFSAVLTAERIPGFADEFNKAVYHIERNANPKVLFMDLSLRLNQIMHS